MIVPERIMLFFYASWEKLNQMENSFQLRECSCCLRQQITEPPTQKSLMESIRWNFILPALPLFSPMLPAFWIISSFSAKNDQKKKSLLKTRINKKIGSKKGSRRNQTEKQKSLFSQRESVTIPQELKSHST